MNANTSQEAQSGTQAIRRAATLLRLLTRRGPEGWRLSEITRASGLTHSTARRILGCLVDERLIERDATSGRYRLGPLNYELGLACEHRLEFRDRARPAIERIARESGDTVYLQIRAGLETVVIDRIEGAYPIRVLLDIGGRRPLGFGAAGLALLAACPEEEVTATVDALGKEIASNPRVSREALLASVDKARERGYGLIRDTTVVGVAAIGVAVPPRPYLPTLGVGIAMVNDRLTPDRIPFLHALLTEQVAQL